MFKIAEIFGFFLFCFRVTAHSWFWCVCSPPSALNYTWYLFLCLFACSILLPHSFFALMCILVFGTGFENFDGVPESSMKARDCVFSEVFSVNPSVPL